MRGIWRQWNENKITKQQIEKIEGKKSVAALKYSPHVIYTHTIERRVKHAATAVVKADNGQ